MLTRRQLVLLSASSIALLGGCTPPQPFAKDVRKGTIEGLLNAAPFFIAHRGSGDNWTEHTEAAYGGASGAGATAIEISTHATRDGVFVCHHDASTLRLTGTDLNIENEAFARISSLRADARQWLGPAAPTEPIPRLKDVLDAHASSSVIFIEDKQGTNTKKLLDLMDTYPDSTKHFVWKQPAASKSYLQARERGYKTWGFFMNGSGPTFQQVAPRHDLLGIFHAASDDEIRQLVGYGKPTICWEVHTRWMRERLLRLGVRGMMCSNIPYLMGGANVRAADTFASGLRGVGDLPSDVSWTSQPLIEAATASIHLANKPPLSYCLGSMAPVTSNTYSLGFHMRWPEEVPAVASAGLAFGQQDDQPYVPTSAGPPGYHLVLDRAGDLSLFSRDQDATSSTRIARIPTAPPLPGAWMQFKVEIAPTSLKIFRLDGPEVSFLVEDATHRGGYFSLCKNYEGQPGVEFRHLELAS
jgi:glycerophosphoryl diester phosphodiesterase